MFVPLISPSIECSYHYYQINYVFALFVRGATQSCAFPTSCNSIFDKHAMKEKHVPRRNWHKIKHATISGWRPGRSFLLTSSLLLPSPTSLTSLSSLQSSKTHDRSISYHDRSSHNDSNWLSPTYPATVLPSSIFIFFRPRAPLNFSLWWPKATHLVPYIVTLTLASSSNEAPPCESFSP